jgi:hypothetical protein
MWLQPGRAEWRSRHIAGMPKCLRLNQMNAKTRIVRWFVHGVLFVVDIQPNQVVISEDEERWTLTKDQMRQIAGALMERQPNEK